MKTLSSIKRLYAVIDNSVFCITGKLNYIRLTDAIIELANAVHDYQGDSDDLWYIGEYGACSLADFLVGAYWHYTEWHAGQASQSYVALCAIGQVFSPGMSGPEDENPAYQALNEMAVKMFTESMAV